MTIYYSSEYALERNPNGDWIDLRVQTDDHVLITEPGKNYLFSLGIKMQLPPYIEAIVANRSSTFKNYGIIMAGGIGVIDCSYNGWDDVWKYHAIALEKRIISFGDRIAQFRLQPSQFAPAEVKEKWQKTSDLVFVNVGTNTDSPKVREWMQYKSRGGFGTTGTN